MAEAHLWTGGRIYTGRRRVDALLVEDGRVIAAGPEASVVRQAPTGTERTALGGRSIAPGLIDAHVHLTEIARQAEGLDLRGRTSADELVSAVERWAADHPGRPVAGRGWDPERWAHPRWPDRSSLDRVAPDVPVVLYHASGHAALANRAALEAIGIPSERPVPEQPTVGHFPDGRPNGLLFEEAMAPLGPLVAEAVPVGPAELGRVAGRLSAAGITAVGAMSSPPGEIEALRQLSAAHALPLTVRGYVRLGHWRAIPAGARGRAGDPVAVVGVKAFLDGAFGPRTAWLSDAYADAPDSTGVPVGDEAHLAEEIVAVRAAGLAPALHAIGDRAVARALHLLASDRDGPGPPARIEHAGLVPPELLPGLDGRRPMLVVQPGFVWSDGWLTARLGSARARWAYPFRTLLDRGIPLAGSSDAPFDPIDPWRGLRAATARRGPDGRSANPDPTEALSPEQALSLYTRGAAVAIGLHDAGTLEVGAPADLVVLAAPSLAAAIDGALPPVVETWVAGRPARTGAPPPLA